MFEVPESFQLFVTTNDAESSCTVDVLGQQSYQPELKSLVDSAFHSSLDSSLTDGATSNSDEDSDCVLFEDGKQQQSPVPMPLVVKCHSLTDTTLVQVRNLSQGQVPLLHVPTKDIIAHRLATLRDAQGRSCLDSDLSSFFVADLGQLVRQHARWRQHLPQVEPFYAVKCNPDPVVLEMMHSLGTHFDCASQAEIESVLRLGVSPTRIIFANPCKSLAHLRFARSRGVTMLTFDNEDELVKMARVYTQRDAQVVLRIRADDKHATCSFGVKFGATSDRVSALLAKAAELQLPVIGVSFHVGSGCRNAMAYDAALAQVAKCFECARTFGHEPYLVDIGGGFPGMKHSEEVVLEDGLPAQASFEDIAKIIGSALERYFVGQSLRVIGEPGRFYAAATFSLVVNITSRRVQKAENGNNTVMYYVNDGVYGSFNCLVFDHASVVPEPLTRNGGCALEDSVKDEPCFLSSLWGPTCDSIDCISKQAMLPLLEVGDWLRFDNMGAYTLCAASTFNGFDKTSIIYTNSCTAEEYAQLFGSL